jgi:hypothetical protein
MTLNSALSQLSVNQFLALILDNEVTVGEFVIDPPLPWARLVCCGGIYRVADGYPNLLTAEQAKFEMRNWDEVSLPDLMGALKMLDGSVDYLLFGNNAGQGLQLAQSLAPSLIGDRAAIIYAERLPEARMYEQIGYQSFFRRSEAVARLLELAHKAGRSLALVFINTIQHNHLNYHDP